MGQSCDERLYNLVKVHFSPAVIYSLGLIIVPQCACYLCLKKEKLLLLLCWEFSPNGFLWRKKLAFFFFWKKQLAFVLKPVFFFSGGDFKCNENRGRGIGLFENEGQKLKVAVYLAALSMVHFRLGRRIVKAEIGVFNIMNARKKKMPMCTAYKL